MSRSSKGFADFFPTAPSVLQQKRYRASQDRRAYRSSLGDDTKSSRSSPAPPVSIIDESEGRVSVNRLADGRSDTVSKPPIQEENEGANGDLAHEIGSASSTSTTSSIFSAGQREVNRVYSNAPNQSTDLTPLTNIDSSPRGNGVNSSPKRSTNDHHLLPIKPLKSPSSPQLSESINLSYSSSACSKRPQARPSKGEVKGFKAVYDPDLDKTLRGKEKKNRSVQFEPFGEEVCVTSF